MDRLELIVRRNVIGIIKSTCAKITANDKKIEKLNNRQQELATTAAGVRSMAYWRSANQSEMCYKENQELLTDLVTVNQLLNFTDMLEHDAYAFLEKYPDVVTRILERGGTS